MNIDETFEALSVKVQGMYSSRDKIIDRLIELDNWDGYDKNKCTLTEIPQHLACYLKLTAIPDCGGTTTGSGKYQIDTEATVNAIPNAYYSFLKWSDNLAQTHNVTIKKYTELCAYFQAYSYKATLNNNGGTGSINSIWWRYNTSTPYYYYYDENLTQGIKNYTLSSLPSRYGYSFEGYRNDSQTYIDKNGVFKNNLYLTHENTTLSAIWTKTIFTLGLTASPSTAGSVTGAGSYSYGTYVTVNAIPNSDAWFKNWSDSKSQSHTVYLISDTTLTAYFQEVSCIATEEDSSGVITEETEDILVTENSIIP